MQWSARLLTCTPALKGEGPPQGSSLVPPIYSDLHLLSERRLRKSVLPLIFFLLNCVDIFQMNRLMSKTKAFLLC